MKKTLAYLLIFCLLFALLPLRASAEVITGACGKNVYYTLDLETKTLTITGKGAIDFFRENDPSTFTDTTNEWYNKKYNVQIETVIIEEGVTTVEEYAFYNFTALTRVELPESVTKIGEAAFEGCTMLPEIQLPSQLKWLDKYVFFNCESLTALTLPNTLAAFDASSVVGCKSLKEINVEDRNPSYTSRDGVLFSKDCRDLVCYPAGRIETDYSVPAEVQYIGGQAFAFCSALRKVESAGSVRKIADSAFAYCTSLQNVILGSKQQEIDEYIFVSCDNLREVYYDYDPCFFRDVKENTYYTDPVRWAAENEITNGMGDDYFQPDGDCTRGQAVTFLWRANGSPKPTSQTMPFQDVSGLTYYFDAVLWAVENGITKGVDETHFAPDKLCTRGEIVTFLRRFAGKPAAPAGEDAGQSEAEAGNPFIDVKKGAFYYDAVLWAVENGVAKGMSATLFEPNGICTRAQIVTFLYRGQNGGE